LPWYKHWFNHPLYLEVYRHRGRGDAAQAVALMHRATGLHSGALVLDLGCGSGRHAMELAQRGFRVTAADLSPRLLQIARETACAGNARIDFVRADMRRLPFGRRFDAVAQMFTAFGYFESDAENAGVIRQVAESLKPGGWYFFDFLNESFVRDHLEPSTERTINGVSVREERSIYKRRVEKRIVVSSLDDGEVRFNESVYMYTAGELAAMFDACGFDVQTMFGDYSGNALIPGSPRCILTGKRR